MIYNYISYYRRKNTYIIASVNEKAKNNLQRGF